MPRPRPRSRKHRDTTARPARASRRFIAIAAVLILLGGFAVLVYDPPPNLDAIAERKGPALRQGLADYAAYRHTPLGYRRARQVMYSRLDAVDTDDDAERDGIFTVYAQRVMPIGPGEFPDGNYVNCEHLWPQSRGARQEPAKSDLYHLRSSVSRINATRANLPFGSAEVNLLAVGESGWEHGHEIDGDEVFEPPPPVRGDIARAMFYFAVRYGHAIDDDEEQDLRRWHVADPVDPDERARAAAIAEAQGNRNPFIERPDLVDRIADF